jgi:hypothetical protein
MTAYVAITEAETDPEAPLTSVLAKKWRDNPIAITEGATGAPKIQRAAVQDAAINRVKLSTGTNSASWSTGSGGGSGTILLDAYSFFPATTVSSSSLTFGGAGTVDAPRLAWTNGGSGSGSATWRYILA